MALSSHKVKPHGHGLVNSRIVLKRPGQTEGVRRSEYEGVISHLYLARNSG